MTVASLILAVCGFFGITSKSVWTLLKTDPVIVATAHPAFEESTKPSPDPPTTTVTHPEFSKPNPSLEVLHQPQSTPTFEELSKPNPVLEALREPQPTLETLSGKTKIAEPNSLFGTISAIGPQITEQSATEDIVSVTVQRAQDTRR